MKIIIVGCGKVGTDILASLLNEDHDITVIEQNASVLEETVNIYDVMGLCGNGADYETLAEAGAPNCDLLIAVTDSDEMNMLSCFLARRMGAGNTIARIRNPEYNDKSLGFMRQHLDLSMSINPELLAAREFFNMLKLPSAAKVETFSGRNFEMVELKLKNESKLDGLRLANLTNEYPFSLLVCVVQRDDVMYIPDGNFVLKSGDRIGITANAADISGFFKKLGIAKKQAKNIMIIGASKTAYYLAKMLLAAGSTVKIIDYNLERCEEFSELLPGVTMICGNGASQELLIEEGIETIDAFVASTGMDEQNIILSYFAESLNVPKVIAKVNRDEFVSMAEKMGIDSIVTPKKIVSDVMIRYARGLQNSLGSKVETLYKIADGKAEILEFIVQNDFKYASIPFKDLRLKNNTLIAGIIRNKKSIIPGGNDVLLPGDRVVVITAGNKMSDLADIIK